MKYASAHPLHRLFSDLAAAHRPRSSALPHSGCRRHSISILDIRKDRRHDYWKARFDTVFDRMRVLGLSFMGLQVPGGRCAHPWPNRIPTSSNNVPTYYHRSTQKPEFATDQLDFVFASEVLVLAQLATTLPLTVPKQCRTKCTIAA